MWYSINMLCLVVLIICAVTIQACPEPITTVHIQNYDGPIIVHSTTCEHCNRSNQPKTNHHEPDCTCVTRQPYAYTQPGYATSNYGYNNQFCKVDDVKVYPVAENTCGYSSNRCSNTNYQYQYPSYCAQ